MSALTPAQAQAVASGDPQALAQALQTVLTALQAQAAAATRPNQTSAAQSPSVGASPYTYTNNTTFIQQVVVSGGTVSAISLSNGGATGLSAEVFVLRPGDSVTVTYSVAPTVFTATNII